MNTAGKKRVQEWLVTAPSLLWLIFLFLIPTLIVFAIAFKPPDLYGGIGAGWTLETLRSLCKADYAVIIWRTLYLSLLTTAARDVVIGWKKNLAKFESEQYKSGVATGEFLLVHGYSGDLLQVQKENPDVNFVIPVEGTSISCDDLVIMKDSKESRLAHAFINFIHDPDVAAENTNFLSYVCPNQSSYRKVDSALRNNPAVFLAPEVKAKCEVIDDLGQDTAKYNGIWDQIKAAD